MAIQRLPEQNQLWGNLLKNKKKQGQFFHFSAQKTGTIQCLSGVRVPLPVCRSQSSPFSPVLSRERVGVERVFSLTQVTIQGQAGLPVTSQDPSAFASPQHWGYIHEQSHPAFSLFSLTKPLPQEQQLLFTFLKSQFCFAF